MKNAGIAIYTVQFNTDNEAALSVLQYCAGSQGPHASRTRRRRPMRPALSSLRAGDRSWTSLTI